MRHNLISPKNRKKWYSINLSKINWNCRNMGIWRSYQESQVQERIRHIKLRKGYYTPSSGAHKRYWTLQCQWHIPSVSVKGLMARLLLTVPGVSAQHNPAVAQTAWIVIHLNGCLSICLFLPLNQSCSLLSGPLWSDTLFLGSLSLHPDSTAVVGMVFPADPQPYSWRGSTSLSVSQLQPLRLFWNFLKSAEFS